MGDGKQGTAMVAEISPKGMMMSQLQNPNPIAHFQVKYKQLEDGFRAWLAKQSLPVEAAVVTATSAVQGAAIGAFMGTLTNDVSSPFAPPPNAALNPEAMASLKQAQVRPSEPLTLRSFDYPFLDSEIILLSTYCLCTYILVSMFFS